MSSPLSAALEKFRPRTEQVLVDETVLVLKPLSIAAQVEFLEAMAALDWSPVMARLKPIIDAVLELDLDDKAGRGRLIAEALPVLAAEGPKLIAAALGVALGPAAAVLLDSEANNRALSAAASFALGSDPFPCEREGATYLRSLPLREWVQRSITAVQAEHVLLTAVELNGWKDRLGKAWAAVRAGTAAPVNGTKPAALETVTG